MPRKRTTQPRITIITRLHLDNPRVHRTAGIVVSVLLLGALAYAAALPFVKSGIKRQEVARLVQQRDAKRLEKERLSKQKGWMQSPEGITALARKQGMVSPNEEIVRFTPPKEEQNAIPAAPAPVAEPTFDSFLLAGFLLFLLAFCTGLGLLLYRRRALRSRRPEGTLTPRSELRKRRRPLHEA